MILIGTDAGIYRWFEGCGWPIFHALQDRSVVGLASPGGGVLVAIDRGGQVLESLNNGQEWRNLPLPEGAAAPAAVAVCGTPPAIVLATRPLALHRRALGAPVPRIAEPKPANGPAWLGRARQVAGGATALIASRRTAAPIDPKVAAQGGWTRLGAVPARGAGRAPEVRALAIGAGTPAPWYAAVRAAGLWRSTDQGASWTQCSGLPTEVLAVRAPRERPGTVYAATADGCWASTDGGQTWEDRSGGLEKTRYLSAIEVKPGAPDTLLAGAAPKGPDEASSAPFQGLEFSLFESSNGGKTWTLVRRGNPDILEHDTIADLRYDPAAPDNAIMALSSGELWTTPNAGAFWVPLARQIRAARCLCAVG